MNKETFITLMGEKEYRFGGKPDTSRMKTDDPDFDWKSYADTNQFVRGHCIIHATDKDIDDLSEENFEEWYEEHSKVYHFPNDWKKKFKGSEFLIPVVEKEFETRKSMLTGDFIIDLKMIDEGRYTLKEVIHKMEETLKK